mgnify:CR=1 FL=1
MKAIIGKAARRKWAWVLALVMTVSILIPTSILTAKAEVGVVKFIDGTSAGWYESAYAQWTIDKEADGYTAYVKKAADSDSAYQRIDNELIRKYNNYYRVDALGLAAGEYVIKVVPVKDGKEVTDKARVTDTLTVSAYDRSGFAFSSKSTLKTGSGAYNEDGTLKDDAIVLYVTNDNAKTITASINEGKKEVEYTGLQTIIDAYTKAACKKTETRSLDVRVIGCLTDSGMDKFSSSSEGVQIKGSNSYSDLHMTFEGVGADASISGFGFLLRNAGNVEMRNLSILNFMDDGISLDTDNCNIWIHNVDLYYGKVGGDSDQAKGDGSIDIKGNSQYITVSYVHFYDSGKCSLCGMKSESGPNYITYHHNWFDHSDSRHARVRTMSVHMYNNYYDGNAKYGAGATMGSSVYVENNYFRNCKYPMLSSRQGSDALGDGTFSGENGGIIKAYGNKIVGAAGIIYANAVSETGAQADATTFDAYLAKSANEKVPSSYKTVAGGTTYDNFDTTVDLGVKAGSLIDAEDVPALVTSDMGAGSLGKGVIDWKFTETEDTDYSVNKELKAAITNYKNTDLVSVGGVNGTVVTPDQPEQSTEDTSKNTESETKTTEAASKAEETTKTQDIATLPGSYTYVAGGSNNSSYFTVSGSLSDKSATYNGKSYSKAVKFNKDGSITFTTTTDNATLSILVSAAKSGASVKVNDDVMFDSIGTSAEFRTVTLGKAGKYVLSKKDKESYIFMVVVNDGDSSETTTAADESKPSDSATETTKKSESTTEATKTTEAATENTTEATQAPTTDTTGSYDKTSLSYSGAYTDISTKKDADFKNAKYVSSSDEIRSAIKSAKAGDVIIVREGTYKFTTDDDYKTTDKDGYTGGPAFVTKANGTADSYIILKAEEGKKVKFDFSEQTLLGSNRGFVADADYWYFQGINFYGAGDNGVLLSGNNNIFEKCIFEANKDSGLQISRYDTNADTKDLWPSNNLIINCTAFNNFDDPTADPKGKAKGENADGFAAKLTCGEGNVFDGCISYCNSDDGWDLFAKTATGPIGVLTIRNCVAFGNGTLTNGLHVADGDMNGFKLGGSGVGTPHKIMNSLSFNNGATGFTDNNNPSALTYMNLTAVSNGKVDSDKANYMCYRNSSDATFTRIISAGGSNASDKLVGKISNSIYYNKDKKNYYSVTGALPVSITSGAKVGTIVSEPLTTAGMFKNTTNFIDVTKDVDAQLRNADGTINMKGLYETTGNSAALGAHFNVANQLVKVESSSNSGKDEPATEPSKNTEDTSKETESSSKETQPATDGTKATESSKETESSKPTQPATDATKPTSTQPSSEEVKDSDMILNANDVSSKAYTESFINSGFAIIASDSKDDNGKANGTVEVDSSSKKYGSDSFSKRIKLSGAASTSARAIAFKTTGAAKVTLIAMSSNKNDSRTVKIFDIKGNEVATVSGVNGKGLASYTLEVPSAGVYYIGSTSGGVNVYKLTVSNAVSMTLSDLDNKEPATEPVTTPATEPATDPVTEPATTPVTEPATNPVTEPATTPVTEPATNPVTEPAINPSQTSQAPSQNVTSASTDNGSSEVKRPEVAADEEVIAGPQAETVSSDAASTSANKPEVAADETKTGDASHMMVYVLILAIAMAGCTCAVVVYKRRRTE